MWRAFLDRGGIWVLAQSALMLAVLVLGPLTAGDWRTWLARVSAGVLFSLGAFFGVSGVWVLGRNRTIFPRPHPDSRLIRHGVYQVVRHPLYTSVICLALGWGVYWASFVTLLTAAGLALLLEAKARHEERWLRQQFPEYDDYARSVKRLIPWVY